MIKAVAGDLGYLYLGAINGKNAWMMCDTQGLAGHTHATLWASDKRSPGWIQMWNGNANGTTGGVLFNSSQNGVYAGYSIAGNKSPIRYTIDGGQHWKVGQLIFPHGLFFSTGYTPFILSSHHELLPIALTSATENPMHPALWPYLSSNQGPQWRPFVKLPAIPTPAEVTGETSQAAIWITEVQQSGHAAVYTAPLQPKEIRWRRIPVPAGKLLSFQSIGDMMFCIVQTHNTTILYRKTNDTPWAPVY